VTSLRLGVGVALVAGWLVLAWFLWGTVVPDGLALPHVDVDEVFGRELVARAVRYERLLLGVWALETAATLGVLALYARYGPRFASESAAGPLGTGMLLGMLGLALVWLTQLPFTVVALWWERRHDVSHAGYLETVFGGWALLGLTFVSLSVALVIVMCLARWLGDWWWIPAAAVLTGIVALVLFVSPYVYPGLERPADPGLVQRYDRIAQAEGVTGIPLRIERVSDTTSQANAFAFGLGPSRRVVLWDTLLDGRFTRGEVDVVLAHELGHHSSDHIPKAIGWFALFALPGALVVMLATRRRGGMGEPRAVPLALVVVAAWALVTSPAQNLVSRRDEAEADWKALQTTRDPASARGLFREFAATSLGDPSPPTWAYLLLETHPTLAQRVAMADAWATRHAGQSVPGTRP
jgi:Zn-dependent protease with chaperone function